MEMTGLPSLQERLSELKGTSATPSPSSTDVQKPTTGLGGGLGAATGTLATSQPVSEGSMRGLGPRKPEQDVSKVAATMLGEDSRLLDVARADGEAYANSRGLLNSSIGAQASERAALDVIVPMASQTAGQNAAKDLSRQNFEQGQDDLVLRAGIDREAADRTFGYNKELAQQDFNFRADQAGLDRDQRERLAAIDVNQQDRRASEGMITNMMTLQQEQIRSIMSNPELSEDERKSQLKSAGDLLNLQVKMTESLFGIDFDFPTGAFNEDGVVDNTDQAGTVGQTSSDAAGSSSTSGSSSSSGLGGENRGDGWTEERAGIERNDAIQNEQDIQRAVDDALNR